MKNNLIISILAYWCAGMGLMVELLGVKAGMNPFIATAIFILSQAFCIYVGFTHLNDLKGFIKKHEDAEKKMFEFEDETTEPSKQ